MTGWNLQTNRLRSALLGMNVPQVVTWITLLAMAVFGSISLAAEPETPPGDERIVATDTDIDQDWPPLVDDGLLSLNLIVRMPDGTQASDSKVTSYSHLRSQIQKFNTDVRGRLTIRDVFGHGANIHATTSDGRLQATLKISAIDTRSKLSTPITLTLRPSVDHPVLVTADGNPVAGASVTILGNCFEISGTTEANGIARLALPANERARGVSAWHRELGVAGVASHPNHPVESSTSLSLEPVAPTSIRVVDDRDNTVHDLDLCVVSLYFSDPAADDQRHLLTSAFPAATIRTNAQGESTFDAVPRNRLAHIHFEPLNNDWKVDRVDEMTKANRSTTVHVRRLKPATGRVVAAPGASVAGLLISGDGFGGNGNDYGDRLVGRVRQDGTFHYRVPTSHGYCVSIVDHEWFSDPWTGLVLKSFDAEPVEITLQPQRSTPIKVKVTQGPDHKPYPNAMVMLGKDKSIRFTTESGEKVNAMGSAMNWMEADANGEVHSGVPVGNVQVRAAVGMWDESKRIKVTADKPVEVAFHCAAPIIVQKRELVARMTRNGSAYQPSPSLKIYAWTDFPPTEIEHGSSTLSMQRATSIHRPNLRSDQMIAVATTEDNAKIMAIDEDTKLAGFVKVQKDQPAGTIEMRPCATLQGTLVNEDGEPLPNRELQSMIGGVAFVPIGSTGRSDANGRFSLTTIPGELPIRLALKPDETQEQDYRVFGDLLFEVAENRMDAKVQAHPIPNAKAPRIRKPAKTIPLSQRLPVPLRDARVSGMHVLVLLQGDESEPTTKLIKRILAEEDDDVADSEQLVVEAPPVDHYLPMLVTKVSKKADVEFVTQQQWPRPNKGEIVLIALDATQTILGTQTLSVSDSEKSERLANEFLHQYKPTFEDAQVKLDAARTLAARTNRRVWVVSCGPRCSPCFQLAHWLESQHDLLDKDYVLVKLMSGLQANADKINKEIGGRSHGIPWFVITEPDGKILITSETPTGNMGMPSTVEDIRHLRKMLEQTARHLTADQIDQLAKSLEQK